MTEAHYVAAACGDSAALFEVLHNEADDTQRMWMANFALVLAAYHGHRDLVRDLCEWGAEVDYRSGGGKTALILAAAWGRVTAAEVLLKYGANKLVQDEKGRIALDFAKRREQQAIIDLLSEQG